MGKDSSEIRNEIEATRARMGETVDALGYKADVPNRVKDAVNDKVETVRGTIGDVVENVKGSMAGATEAIGDALGGVRRETSDRVGDVAGRLPDGGDVRMMARRGVGIAMENPLGLALGALAVGFLAGLAAPVTDLERKTVGPIRDDLVDRAKSKGSDMIQHGKQVLQDTAASAFRTT
jgi:hypothetical protein